MDSRFEQCFEIEQQENQSHKPVVVIADPWTEKQYEFICDMSYKTHGMLPEAFLTYNPQSMSKTQASKTIDALKPAFNARNARLADIKREAAQFMAAHPDYND